MHPELCITSKVSAGRSGEKTTGVDSQLDSLVTDAAHSFTNGYNQPPVSTHMSNRLNRISAERR